MANFTSMQWTHPGILWALLLLAIPLLIHLFEWRRFRKAPFTNLKMLREVEESSRKSRNIKKWLLLITRSLAILCLVSAFAQPYWNRALTPEESAPISIYLDNSYSMQARKGGVSLLEEARQELIKTIPARTRFNVLTNDFYLAGITREQLRPELLETGFSHTQLDWEEVSAAFIEENKRSGQGDWILISDFQNPGLLPPPDTLNLNERVHFWPLKPDLLFNSYVDTLETREVGADLVGLNIQLRSAPETRVPVQVRVNGTPYSNTSVTTDSLGIGRLQLQLPGRNVYGVVEVTDQSIAYDNKLYFSLQEPNKTRVVAISDTGEDFLGRLFDFPEFQYEETRWANFNYGTIGRYDWLVLNEVSELPQNFVSLLDRFMDSGGGVLLIPSADARRETYNRLLAGSGLEFGAWRPGSQQEISRINYDHPIYKDVFYKRAGRFDYPRVNGYFEVQGSAGEALGFANTRAFLLTTGRMGIFTAPLNKLNSDFQRSPLIVSTFQNIVRKEPSERAFYTLSTPIDLRVPIQLPDDHVIKLKGEKSEYIPAQNRYENFTELQLREIPREPGIHFLRHETDTLRALAFNAKRTESSMVYVAPDDRFEEASVLPSLTDYFDRYREYRKGYSYWKWFLLGAFLFLLIEWLIQKSKI